MVIEDGGTFRAKANRNSTKKLFVFIAAKFGTEIPNPPAATEPGGGKG